MKLVIHFKKLNILYSLNGQDTTAEDEMIKMFSLLSKMGLFCKEKKSFLGSKSVPLEVDSLSKSVKCAGKQKSSPV